MRDNVVGLFVAAAASLFNPILVRVDTVLFSERFTVQGLGLKPPFC